MYRKRISKCLWLQATTSPVMRYRGPTWEPWGSRSTVEEGVALVAPALNQFIILPRQDYWRAESVMLEGLFSSYRSGTAKRDWISSVPFIMRLTPVQSTCTEGLGNFYASWEIMRDTYTVTRQAFFFCQCSQAAYTKEFKKFKWSLNTRGSVPQHYLQGCRRESGPEMGQ